jgi:HSP20 family protein
LTGEYHQGHTTSYVFWGIDRLDAPDYLGFGSEASSGAPVAVLTKRPACSGDGAFSTRATGVSTDHNLIYLGRKFEMTAQPATAMQPIRGSVPVRQGPTDINDQFDRIYDAIARRAFELFEGNGQWSGHELDDWLRAEAEILHPLHMDIRESDSDFVVRAEAPGFNPKELEIKVEPRRLTIAGRREFKEEKNGGKKLRSECCADQILRSIELPVDVDANKVSATLRDGILTVDLPKAPHAKAVRIEPKSA